MQMHDGMEGYDLEYGKRLVGAARSTIEAYTSSYKFHKSHVEHEVYGLKGEHGIYVAIMHYPTMEPRGSSFMAELKLQMKDAIVAASIEACNDERYVPVSHRELDDIVVEVAIIGEMRQIGGSISEIRKSFEIGKDGLLVEHGYRKAVILPNPAQEDVSKDDLLEGICISAGIDRNAWKHHKGTKLFAFPAHVFIEKEPRGIVEEIV